jgi:hypothetical protein
MLDLIEVLYREGIMAPVDDGMPADSYEQAPAQLQFREWVNPVLARRDPPLELNESGVIEEQVAEPFRRLIEQPLPQEAPKREVTDRVADAISHFKRRGATIGDRRAAARELADVLEFLRKDVQVHMLKKDEGDLYRLANDFALRHNKPETRRDFEEAVWLSWTFYVYLATIRLVLELKRRSAAVSS